MSLVQYLYASITRLHPSEPPRIPKAPAASGYSTHCGWGSPHKEENEVGKTRNSIQMTGEATNVEQDDSNELIPLHAML